MYTHFHSQEGAFGGRHLMNLYVHSSELAGAMSAMKEKSSTTDAADPASGAVGTESALEQAVAKTAKRLMTRKPIILRMDRLPSVQIRAGISRIVASERGAARQAVGGSNEDSL